MLNISKTSTCSNQADRLSQKHRNISAVLTTKVQQADGLNKFAITWG